MPVVVLAGVSIALGSIWPDLPPLWMQLLIILGALALALFMLIWSFFDSFDMGPSVGKPEKRFLRKHVF
jgi:hypothetical protein